MSEPRLPEYSLRTYENALRIADPVINLADEMQTAFYSQIMRAHRIGRGHIGKTLYVIDAACRRLQLPRINLLIVLKDTGLPSPGCGIDYGEYRKYYDTVSLIDWSLHRQRLIDELRLMLSQRREQLH